MHTVKRINTTWYKIAVVASFVALFPPAYFSGEIKYSMMVVLDIFSLISAILLNYKKKKKSNPLIIFVLYLFISSLVILVRHGSDSNDIIKLSVYCLSMFTFSEIVLLARTRGAQKSLIRTLLFIVSVYCMISFATILVPNPAFPRTYFFGNKFPTGYLFVLLIALLGTNKKYSKTPQIIQALYYFVILGSMAIIFYMDCMTAVVVVAMFLFVPFIGKNIGHFLSKKRAAVISFIISGALCLILSLVGSLPGVSYVISSLLNRNIDFTGRLPIYQMYMFPAIQRNIFFGNAYGNKAIFEISGIYENAHNCFFNVIVNYGVCGLILFLVCIYFLMKRNGCWESCPYLYYLYYALVVASVIEASTFEFVIVSVLLISVFGQENQQIIDEKSLRDGKNI